MTVATEIAAGWFWGIAKGANVTGNTTLALSTGTGASAAVRTKFKLPSGAKGQAYDVDASGGSITITVTAPTSADYKSRIHFNRIDQNAAATVTVQMSAGNLNKSEVNPDAGAGGSVTLGLGGFVTLEGENGTTCKLVGGATGGLASGD